MNRGISLLLLVAGMLLVGLLIGGLMFSVAYAWHKDWRHMAGSSTAVKLSLKGPCKVSTLKIQWTAPN